MTNLIILKDELGLSLTGNELTLELKAALVVGGSGTWGTITGTLSSQTDLQNALDDKADASALQAHESAADPHPQYLQSSDVGSAAFTSSTAYATAAQGATADTALQPNDGLFTLDSSAASKLGAIEPGAQVNVQSDWNAVSGDAFIQNKPSVTGAIWGSVTGTLADQTDLQNALNAKASASALSAHTSDTNNPHGTTKTHVGLSNVDNTADASKNVLSATKWTTSRTLTIGNTGKAVDGSADTSWSLAEIGAGTGDGDVVGPASSTDNHVVVFDGITGKLVKDGGALGTAAFTASSAYATAAQGATADNALPKAGGTMTGAITFDGGQTWPTFNQNTTGTAANVTGTVAIANGGTGAVDAATARSNLGAGDVSGPASATDGNVAIFDGATGKLVKNKADVVILDSNTGKTTAASLGPELLTNGDFSNGSTGWTTGTGWSISGAAIYDATTNSPGTLSQTVYVETNSAYYIEWTAQSSNELNASMNAQLGASVSGTILHPQTLSVQTYSVVLIADSTGYLNLLLNPTKQRGQGTVTITNVSLKRIYHTSVDFTFKSSDGSFDVTQRGSNTFFGGGGLRNNTGTGNFSLGYNALFCNYSGTDNIGVGQEALYANSVGIGNLAFGYQTLYENTLGNYNIALGYQSLRKNTWGDNNIGVGYRTLVNNILGRNCIAIGFSALGNNTTALNNIALGNLTLASATTGGGNTGIGREALKSLTTGEANVAIGASTSMWSLTTGSNNVGVGHTTLYSNVSGSNNAAFGRQAARYYGSGSDGLSDTTKGVYLGYNCRASANSASNQIVIGADAVGVGNNTARIGDSNITLLSTAGQLLSTGSYSNTSASAANVFIDTDGKIYRSTSSSQYKTDIEPIDTAIADKLILQANPVWYRSTSARDAGKSYYGLIAEEVAELDPRMVQWGYPTKRVTVLEAREETADVYDGEGNLVESGQPAIEAQYADVPDYNAQPIPEGVNYTAMIAPLIDLVKRQQAAIESLTARVTALEKGSGGKVLQ